LLITDTSATIILTTLLQVLLKAYWPKEIFPFMFSFLEIDPKHIDVNVHPTKTEIKFDDERAVYGVVWAAVKQALGAHNLTPAIDFQSDINIVGKLSQNLTKEQYMDEQFSTALHRSNLQNWEKAFDNPAPQSRLFQSPEPEGKVLRFESSLNQSANNPCLRKSNRVFNFNRSIL
jgi:DNA mismatch repair protein MutL